MTKKILLGCCCMLLAGSCYARDIGTYISISGGQHSALSLGHSTKQLYFGLTAGYMSVSGKTKDDEFSLSAHGDDSSWSSHWYTIGGYLGCFTNLTNKLSFEIGAAGGYETSSRYHSNGYYGVLFVGPSFSLTNKLELSATINAVYYSHEKSDYGEQTIASVFNSGAISLSYYF